MKGRRIELQVVASACDRMKHLILVCTLFQAIYIGAADEKLNFDHQDGGIISVLLKKIRDLEERDREFNRKLEEIDILKARLDEAQRRLAYMQEFEYRLQNAEERIQMLVNRVDNNNADCKMNKSATMRAVDTNRTRDTIYIGSSSPFWTRLSVSNIESRQAEMGEKIAELLSFKNRIQTALKVSATKNRKRTVTRKAAFTAMFSSTYVPIIPGRSLQFDRVEYNEGNAYDTKTGIFTCPVSGTYLFFTNVLSLHQAGAVGTEIVLEGQGKVRTHAMKEDSHDQGSTAVSLHCDAGRRVWVQTVYGSQIFGDMCSSFTGVLLWQDDAATDSN